MISPNAIKQLEFDKVFILSMGTQEVKKQLLKIGIPDYKIDSSYVDALVKARINFVRDYAKVIYKFKISGSVAEAGVFRGEFAKIINEAFPDRKLYLFDTFEGFDERDIPYERDNNFSDYNAGDLNWTSEKLVLDKMIHKENVLIKKGYFPDSAADIEERFCFVNLDMDLYKPIFEGLKFFYPLMVPGGIIVIHDYYSEGCRGVNAAIEEFVELHPEILPFPIGDDMSIAIQKPKNIF